MQLSRLPVGHGVVESRVEDGSLFHHPVKRTRTTLGYIMIALFGTDRERLILRSEVNSQHRHVQSDSESPVPYDASDPELQLWVAACMFRGLEDAIKILYRSTSPETLDLLYRHCSRFATTLQVPISMWPATRESFESYWAASISLLAVDEATRAYLLQFASLKFLPVPMHRVLGGLHLFVTKGFLPPAFRDTLGLSWTSGDQRRFQLMMSTAALVNRLLPRVLREFPWNIVLWDTRRRLGRGRSFV